NFAISNFKFQISNLKSQPRAAYIFPGTLTIQLMPNLSVTIPKHGDQKVFASGIVTLPPSLNAAKARLASASSVTANESEKPLKFSASPQPSDAINVEPPMVNVVCITLFS